MTRTLYDIKPVVRSFRYHAALQRADYLLSEPIRLLTSFSAVGAANKTSILVAPKLEKIRGRPVETALPSAR
jgi:hypothetical protein